jgi:hypothetical protein
VTAPEHDPACDMWAGFVYRYDPTGFEQTYPRPEPGTVVAVMCGGEVIGTVTWGGSIPTEASECGLPFIDMPDRWEGDDS